MNFTLLSRTAIALVVAAAAIGCSSSSSSGGTTPPADTGPAGETGGALSCNTYCALIAKNCTGDHAQYVDDATCMAMCAKFDVGTAADTSGDTLGCRTYHATAAGTDANTHCTHSGPYGGNTCGASRCDNLCKLDLALCPKSGTGLYADQASCVTACKAAGDLATGKELDPGQPGKLNCIEYHLEAAAKDSATHCGHITTASGPCKAP